MDSAPTKLQEVSLEEALSMAIFFQKNAQLEDAEKIYRKVLEILPEHVDALHYSGVLAHQLGRSDEAVALIERSLQLEPEQADCYSNLGIIFKARGRHDEAVAAYRQAITLNPNHASAYNNLGVLLKGMGELGKAEEAYRAAIRLNAEYADAYHNLGNLLVATKRVPEAVICFSKATTLNPHHSEARRLLALAYCTIGERDKAVAIFEKWLAEEPDNAIAKHMLAACSGKWVPSRASDAYVEKIFDDFAASFDTKLAKLAYRAPALVAAMVADSGVVPEKKLDVLDAGCGTGLCGPLVAPYARTLVGVDLSSRMLGGAREKHIYDELIKCELTQYLAEHANSFDLIVCADTLVYFGDLAAVLSGAAAALRSTGSFFFTCEAATAEEASAGYAIEPHGRYRHSHEYIERVLQDTGFTQKIVHAELRMEAGAPVKGLVVHAEKTR